MSQKRLSGLSLLLVKNEGAKNLDLKKVIQQFASEKVRRKNFESPVTHTYIT